MPSALDQPLLQHFKGALGGSRLASSYVLTSQRKTLNKEPSARHVPAAAAAAAAATDVAAASASAAAAAAAGAAAVACAAPLCVLQSHLFRLSFPLTGPHQLWYENYFMYVVLQDAIHHRPSHPHRLREALLPPLPCTLSTKPAHSHPSWLRPLTRVRLPCGSPPSGTSARMCG